MKMSRYLQLSLYLVIHLILVHGIIAQQTVGIIRNSDQSNNGYKLIAPIYDSTTYLINNCGEVVHVWQSQYLPGVVAYMMPNGSLLRSISTKNPNPTFPNSNGGGFEVIDWNGNLNWHFDYSNDTVMQHHDVEFLPNGNVLMLAYHFVDENEAIAHGRNTLFSAGGIWTESILEIHRTSQNTGEIVWQWNSWDHIIQDFDSSKSNYGIIAENPGSLNINYPPSGGNGNNPPDWLHANSISYNAALDLIILSARATSEFYIIDHSTSTTEASSNSGGNYGKGGQVLYRWGNPEAYDRGDSSNRRLYFQHDVHWMEEDESNPLILLFNNGTDRPGGNYSSVDELKLPLDSLGYFPNIEDSGTFEPESAMHQIDLIEQTNYYSPFISGAQRLPDQHTLVCIGWSGRIVELDENANVVWEYINPVDQNGIVSQGDTVEFNLLFRAYHFPENYTAFEGKTLAPQGYIELNPTANECTLYGQNEVTNLNDIVSIFPNPATSELIVKTGLKGLLSLEIRDGMSKIVYKNQFQEFAQINISELSAGVYHLTITSPSVRFWQKIVKY